MSKNSCEFCLQNKKKQDVSKSYRLSMFFLTLRHLQNVHPTASTTSGRRVVVDDLHRRHRRLGGRQLRHAALWDVLLVVPSDKKTDVQRTKSKENVFKNKKISFGGIPNSSSIDILMPYAILDYMGAFLRSSFAYVDNVIPVIKTITWLLLSRLQGNKPHRNSPEPSEPGLRNLHQHAPELSRTVRNLPEPTFRNLPEPTSWTYAIIQRNPPKSSRTCLRNLHHFTPQLSGTFRNLPPEPTPFYTATLRNLPEPASGTYTILHRNSPEPSGTRLRNLHQHTPELSGTFRNLPLRPAPAHTGAYLGWRPH